MQYWIFFLRMKPKFSRGLLYLIVSIHTVCPSNSHVKHTFSQGTITYLFGLAFTQWYHRLFSFFFFGARTGFNHIMEVTFFSFSALSSKIEHTILYETYSKYKLKLWPNWWTQKDGFSLCRGVSCSLDTWSLTLFPSSHTTMPSTHVNWPMVLSA